MKVLKHSDKNNCMNINTFLQLIILGHTTVYALLLCNLEDHSGNTQ